MGRRGNRKASTFIAAGVIFSLICVDGLKKFRFVLMMGHGSSAGSVFVCTVTSTMESWPMIVLQ